MSIDWPGDLVDAIARRRCVIFLGSGISRQCTNQAGKSPKTWKDFLISGLNQLHVNQNFFKTVKSLIRRKDYLLACQMMKDAMGNTRFHDLVRSEYLTPRFNHSPIHDAIIVLDVRVVATPNFDKIFENRINSVQGNSVLVKNYYDTDIAETLRGTNRIVMKIHGTIDEPPKMIFTRQEYAAARQKYREFYDILAALSITQVFLFMGCGLNDPDISLLLEDYAFKYDYACPHYFVLPEGYVKKDAISATEKSLNIKILEYNPRRNHTLLKNEVDALRLKVDVRRAEIQKTTQW